MIEKTSTSPDGATSGSMPNGCSAVKADTAPKLDLQREGDRRQERAPTASDTPRGARKMRVAAFIATLLVVLGIGWGAGLKTHESVNLGQVSTWVEDTVGALASNLDAQRKKMIANIEGLKSTSASQETISPEEVRDEINTAEIIEREAKDLSIKIDQLRAYSATAVGELGRGIERVNESVERSQRELLAKLDLLQERLQRVERLGAGARQVQPLEQPAAAHAPVPLHAPGPPITAAPPKPTAPTQLKRIENWTVTDVVDGMAILSGPKGIVGVTSGDVVPGVGRIESIARRGGRWEVATSKGVITGR